MSAKPRFRVWLVGDAADTLRMVSNPMVSLQRRAAGRGIRDGWKNWGIHGCLEKREKAVGLFTPVDYWSFFFVAWLEEAQEMAAPPQQAQAQARKATGMPSLEGARIDLGAFRAHVSCALPHLWHPPSKMLLPFVHTSCPALISSCVRGVFPVAGARRLAIRTG
jgi:hypothetical protein